MAVALTYDNTLSRVQITVTGIVATTDEVLIERSTDQVSWVTVRGGDALTPVAGTVTLDDYEFTGGVVNYYRASFVDTGPASFVGVGTAASNANLAGTSTVTPTLPAHIAGDSLYAFASIRNSGTGTVAALAGWTTLITFGNVAVLGRRATAPGTTAPTIGFTGGVANATILGQTFVLRNVNLAPAAAHPGQLNSSAQNVAYPALTVPGAGHIVVVAGWKQDDWTSVAAIGGYTEAQETTTTLGDDASQVVDYQVQTTAVNVTAGSLVVTGGLSAISRALVAAFEPADFTTQETGSITPVMDSIWLKSVARPFLNRPIDVIMDGGQVITRDPRDGVFQIVGRSLPVAVTDLRGSRRWTMRIRTYTWSDAEEMDLILSAGDVMFVHSPTGCQVRGGHVRIATTSQTWHPLRPDMCTFDLPLTEVAAPTGAVVGAVGTWQTVLNTYISWADVLAQNTSWADLLELVGAPGDVIVA